MSHIQPEQISSAPTRPTVWFACVEINDHDKAYFSRQLEGFAAITPDLIAWRDFRSDQSGTPSFQPAASWTRRWNFKGGFRAAQLFDRIIGRFRKDPRGTTGAEKAALLSHAKKTQPDIIYAHTGFVGLRLLPIAKATGAKLVVHFHGLDINIADPVYRTELRRNIHAFDEIIVVGHWMVDKLVDFGADATRISVIPMGSPLDGESGKLSRPGDGATFISVCRLIAYKGIDRSIRAFGIAQESDPSLTYTIIGDGPLRGSHEALTMELGLSGAVRFLGRLSAKETLDEVKKSDVFLHHALDEPDGPEAFGVVITEAMALGKPVVGTYCGGLPDQIVDGETGFLVDQEDVSGMAAAMVRLSSDAGLRARMGKAGAERARTHFDAHDLARQVENLLLQVAAR